LVNCLSNIKSMQNNQVVITQTSLHKKTPTWKENKGFKKPKERKNENIYLITRKFASQKKQKIYIVSLCFKKCEISFPIQYCFLKAWILKNTIFMIKKYDFFFLVNESEKKLCTNTRKNMKKYERTNIVFKMIFSEMRLFVQKIIAFWMTASLVWVLGGFTRKRAWLCS